MLPKPYLAKSSLLPFLIISLLIHALAFWWLMRMQSQAIAPMVAHKETNTTIKARLWQAPARVAPEPEPEAEPEPIPKPEPSQIEPEAPPPLPPEQPDRQVAKQSEEPESVPDSQTPAGTESVSEPVVKPINVGEYQSAAQRHLSAWQGRQQQKSAEQAATEYRQQRQNPIGEIPDYTEKLSEDEKLRQAVTKEVNCEAGINGAITSLMRIAGGAVRCTDRGAFQQYIDKRLNKAQNE